MKSVLKLTVAAAAMVGASLFAAAPAQADSFGLSFGSRGGIGFSYDTGGYCDRWGCPDGFWDYPIAYCPVFFDDEWYRGPFYYRYFRGDYYYWIHGGWHRDEWDSDRPPGFCEDRFGPALGFDFYSSHGFRWRDDWRRRWDHEHGGRDNGWDRSGRDNGWDRGGRDNSWDRGGRDNGFDRRGNVWNGGGVSPFNGTAGAGGSGGSGFISGSGTGDGGHHRRDGGSNAGAPSGTSGGTPPGSGTGGNWWNGRNVQGSSGSGGSGGGAAGTSGTGGTGGNWWNGRNLQGGLGSGGSGGGAAGTSGAGGGSGGGTGTGGWTGHSQQGGSGTGGPSGGSSGTGSGSPGDKPHGDWRRNHAEP